jgi:hypothetical protein
MILARTVPAKLYVRIFSLVGEMYSPGIFISPVQKVFSLATILLPNTANLTISKL